MEKPISYDSYLFFCPKKFTFFNQFLKNVPISQKICDFEKGACYVHRQFSHHFLIVFHDQSFVEQCNKLQFMIMEIFNRRYFVPPILESEKAILNFKFNTNNPAKIGQLISRLNFWPLHWEFLFLLYLVSLYFQLIHHYLFDHHCYLSQLTHNIRRPHCLVNNTYPIVLFVDWFKTLNVMRNYALNFKIFNKC